MSAINIGKDRQVFWDEYLIDKARTSAFPRLMTPEKKECSFLFDQSNESEFSISYPCIVKDEKGYKMYWGPDPL